MKLSWIYSFLFSGKHDIIFTPWEFFPNPLKQTFGWDAVRRTRSILHSAEMGSHMYTDTCKQTDWKYEMSSHQNWLQPKPLSILGYLGVRVNNGTSAIEENLEIYNLLWDVHSVHWWRDIHCSFVEITNIPFVCYLEKEILNSPRWLFTCWVSKYIS